MDPPGFASLIFLPITMLDLSGITLVLLSVLLTNESPVARLFRDLLSLKMDCLLTLFPAGNYLIRLLTSPF